MSTVKAGEFAAAVAAFVILIAVSLLAVVWAVRGLAGLMGWLA